jgi:hypothetical protein
VTSSPPTSESPYHGLGVFVLILGILSVCIGVALSFVGCFGPIFFSEGSGAAGTCSTPYSFQGLVVAVTGFILAVMGAALIGLKSR